MSWMVARHVQTLRRSAARRLARRLPRLVAWRYAMGNLHPRRASVRPLLERPPNTQVGPLAASRTFREHGPDAPAARRCRQAERTRREPAAGGRRPRATPTSGVEADHVAGAQ